MTTSHKQNMFFFFFANFFENSNSNIQYCMIDWISKDVFLCVNTITTDLCFSVLTLNTRLNLCNNQNVYMTAWIGYQIIATQQFLIKSYYKILIFMHKTSKEIISNVLSNNNKIAQYDYQIISI